MAPKRLAAGELERRVLDLLWSSPEPLTPGAVHERVVVTHDVAYTTVMTILARLWEKGIAHRERVGRAYEYRPAKTREDTVADQLADVLSAASDPVVALARFVDSLEPDEQEQLRKALRPSATSP